MRSFLDAVCILTRAKPKGYDMFSQLSTLRVIRRMQPVSTGALARAAFIGYATLTGILDRLEEHGYVTRTRDPGDRRTVILNMTKQGDRLLASAPSLLQSRLREGLARMPTNEQTAVLDSLLQVAALMEAEKGNAAASED